MSTFTQTLNRFDPQYILRSEGRDAFSKLDSRIQTRNPVMFVVGIGASLTTLLVFDALGGEGETLAWFIGSITLWLWFTTLCAH